MFHGARILVAPLDWGLGHATRCIPLIKRLLERGATPILGADDAPMSLLQRAFPALEQVRIPGVAIRYSAGGSQLWSMTRQFPAMLRGIRAERGMMDRLRSDLHLDAVISDQRFGLHHPALPSVLITHQVFPFTPLAQKAMRRLNRRYMERFDRCWIMDEPDPPGLAGALSHGDRLPHQARYIGTLSRLAPKRKEGQGYGVVAVISGPEPQRTLLEQRLTQQLRDLPGAHLLVRGQPGQQGEERDGNLLKVPHLDAEELSQVMCSAELIVSRSGYTTLMDLVAMGRSALVIPTPGQEEQEYLGRLHANTGRFLVQGQDRIDIRAALERPPLHRSAPVHQGALLEEALDDLGGLLR